jgi:hypothetical protein
MIFIFLKSDDFFLPKKMIKYSLFIIFFTFVQKIKYKKRRNVYLNPFNHIVRF